MVGGACLRWVGPVCASRPSVAGGGGSVSGGQALSAVSGGLGSVGPVPACSGRGPRTRAARSAAPNCSPRVSAEVHYERRAHLLPEDLRDPALRTGARRQGRGPCHTRGDSLARLPGHRGNVSVLVPRARPGPQAPRSGDRRPSPRCIRPGSAGLAPPLEPARTRPRAAPHLLLLRPHHAAATAPGAPSISSRSRPARPNRIRNFAA